MEVAFTRTSTSLGPIAGTGTLSICKPFPGCVLRNALIIVAMACARLQEWLRATEMFSLRPIVDASIGRRSVQGRISTIAADAGNGAGDRGIEDGGATRNGYGF